MQVIGLNSVSWSNCQFDKVIPMIPHDYIRHIIKGIDLFLQVRQGAQKTWKCKLLSCIGTANVTTQVKWVHNNGGKASQPEDFLQWPAVVLNYAYMYWKFFKILMSSLHKWMDYTVSSSKSQNTCTWSWFRRPEVPRTLPPCAVPREPSVQKLGGGLLYHW